MTRREVEGTFPSYLSQMATREDFTYDAIGRLDRGFSAWSRPHRQSSVVEAVAA
jgi:hypothetical protein